MTRRVAATAWIMALLLFAAGAARADAVVTACVADDQVGAGVNLAQAIAAGGVIRFACPAGSTIRVTGRYVLLGSTLIDGGDAVTLDGRGAVGPMMQTTENVILRRITLRGFTQRRAGPVEPGARSLGRITGSVLAASGDAELDRVTVEGSDFAIDVRGKGTVRDSAFVGNVGIALAIDGEAFVERTRFTGNGLALSLSAGSVQNCDFSGQTSGAISVRHPIGPVEIRHSTFTATRGGPALALSQRAGRGGSQTVTVRANVFRDNDGGTGAGAIGLLDTVQAARDRGQSSSVVNALASLPPVGFVLGYNRFLGNRGGRGGAIAADLAQTSGMVSKGDLFVGNASAGEGGAVAVAGGPLRLSHSLFKANRAGTRGGALVVAADASATLANTLVVGNVASSGAIAGGAVTLANVTIADNDAVGLLLDGTPAQIGNVLFARNRPADCAGVPAGALRGGGLQSDGSCPDLAVGEAFLDAFYVPAIGSPALRAGDPGLCRSDQVGGLDLPFQGRNDPTACALGAFEHPPLRKFSSRTDRREVHADAGDDFTDDEGYRPPPGEQSPSCVPAAGATLPALAAAGIDFSVPEADLRQWLNSCLTPYPPISAVLLMLLGEKHLRQPVYLDVIVFNYESSSGAASPRSVPEVDPDRLMAAVVNGYNTRYGTSEQNFQGLLQ